VFIKLKKGGIKMPNEGFAMNDQVSKQVNKAQDSSLNFRGWFEIDHIRDGQVIDHRVINNTITNAGLAEVAGLINADQAGSLNAFDYIAIGTGTTSASASDTQLEHEITSGGGSRRGGADVTGTRVTTSVTNDTSQWVTTFTFTASFAVTESGIFNQSSGGTMLARQTFSAINVTSGDSLQITWKVQCS